MWADNETTLDLIGFRVHADLIRSVITDSSLLPLTVGLFGDWGGGKTSIMKMLQHDIDPENHPENSKEREKLEGVACLYFNGWLFEGYDDAKSALLSSILIELSQHKKFGIKLRDKAAELLGSVDWMRLARLGFREVALPALLAYLTGGVSVIPSIITSITAAKPLLGNQTGQTPATDPKFDWEEYLKKDTKPAGPMDVRNFRGRFSKMLEESGIESLIVLIDDLDRCSPQRIIDNLEAIKLFLNVERTAFVIGADPRIVRHAIASVYKPEEIQTQSGELDRRTDIVTDYLEKLIQLPYSLPRLSPAEVQTYMAMLFCRKELSEKDFGRVFAALERHRDKDRYSVFGYGAISDALGKEMLPDLLSRLTFCASVAPLITDGLKGNPRQVKRFLNAFILRKKLADVAHLANIKDDVLVKLMVLEYTQLMQFNELFQWQSTDDGYPKNLKALEAALCPADGKAVDEEVVNKIGPTWSSRQMRRWVVSEPHLSDVDLRDYFWVARDRLQSTLSDVALVPPIVRKIVEGLLSSNPATEDATHELINGTSADEKVKVLNLLARQIQLNPDEIKGYDAFRMLIEWDAISDAVSILDTALQSVQSSTIPPSFGLSLLNLQKSSEKYRDSLAKIIDRLSQTNTRVAAAIKVPQKKGK